MKNHNWLPPLRELLCMGGFCLIVIFWLANSIFLEPELNTVSLWTTKIDYAAGFTCFQDSGKGPDENFMEIKYRNATEKPGKITFAIPPRTPYWWQKSRPTYSRLLFRLGWGSTPVHLQQVTLNRKIFFVNFPLIRFNSEQLNRIVSDYMHHKTKTTLHNGQVTLSSKTIIAPWMALTEDELTPFKDLTTPDKTMQIAAFTYCLTCWVVILLGLLKRKYLFKKGKRIANELLCIVKNRTVSMSDNFQPLNQKKLTGLSLTTCALLVTLFIRSWDNLTIPSLYIEDTWWYFNWFGTGISDFSKIFVNENGYPVIITKFLAWLIGHFKLSIQPYIYLYLALVVSLLCVLIPFYFGLFRSWVILLVGPFVLCLSGMSNIFYLTTLSYVIFTGIVLLLILLLLPEPKSLVGLIGRMILISTLTWAGPYSALSVPVALLGLALFKTTRQHALLLVWSILGAIIYFLFVDSGTSDPLAIIRNPLYLTTFFTVFLDQILFLDLFGNIDGNRMILFIAILLLLLYLLMNDHAYVKLSLILFAVIILNLYLVFGSVKFGILRKVMDNYLFISYFFWLIFLLTTLDRLLLRFRQPVAVSILTGVVLLLFVYIDNQVHTDKWVYPTRPGMMAYLKDIEFLEANSGILVENKMYVEHFAALVKPNIKRPYVYFGYDGPGKKRTDISKFRAMVQE